MGDKLGGEIWGCGREGEEKDGWIEAYNIEY